MAFLDKNGLQTLTNKLTQGDAIKVASHRGHTVTNVIDNIKRECDNISTPNTMKIENNIPNFKIGQGVDLDVSGDVEEGKVEVELKGKTYQNLLDDSGWLHIEKTITSNHSNNVALTSASFLGKSNLMKPSTKYTLILNFDISLNTLKNTYLQINYEYEPNKQAMLVHIGSVSAFLKNGGEYRVSFITPENFQRVAQVFIGGYGGTLTIKSNGMTILEGDHTQTPTEELPKYFEGIKSSFEDGIVDVEVQGKNLFNKTIDEIELENEALLEKIDEKEFNLSFVEGKLSRGIFKKLIGTGKKQTLSIDTKFIQGQYGNGLSVVVREANFGISYAHYKIPNNSQYTRARMSFIVPKGQEYWILLYKTLQTDPSCKVGFRNIQIDNYCSNVEYEPYYKKKISFNIGEPLRSLPNGTCDEIRNNNGQWELVRRIGKVTLTGNETGWGMDKTDEYCRFVIYIQNCHKGTDSRRYIISNNFSSTNISGFTADSLGFTYNGYVYLYKNFEDVSTFKQWLSQNPTKIYYELEEPAISPIEPIEFDIKPLASMNINSHIVPTSTHSVILNRAGQIERGIVEIAKLKERVEALEVAYDSHFIETQHKLSVLGLEYELEGGNY